MADKASVRTGINALIAENWSQDCIDTTMIQMPLMGAFIGKFGDKSAGPIGLGIPNSRSLFSGSKHAKIRRKEILSGRIYQPLIHHLLPNESDGRVVGVAGHMGSVENWEDNGPAKRFKRPSVKWCELTDPCEVSNQDIENTRAAAAGERNGWEAIRNLIHVERNDRLAKHLERWNQLLWGTYAGGAVAGASRPSTTGAPTDEDADKWDAIYSIANALGTTNTYCGIDRSVSGNEFWKGNTISAATSANFRELIRYANYGMTLPDGKTGLASKGGGIDLLVVGGALFQTALAEADAKSGTRILPGEKIPAFGNFGFAQDTVRIDNTWVIFDPTCPASVVAGLNLNTWTLAIQPSKNFSQTETVDNSIYKGGDDSTSWHIRTEIMLICEAPSWNVYWTAVS
jgi:hypothetical protein